MSNNKRVNRKRRRSPWYKMFGKTETRLSARVTSEEDWQTDVPNIRLSRAFVIVLLMHLVVGGALIAFTLMNPGDAKAADNVPAKKKSTPKVAKVEKQEKAKETRSASSLTSADRMDDMRRHIVHSGDSVAKIAGQYGVSSEEIHAVNRIDELYQLYQGRVLRIPVSASKPIELNNSNIAEKASTNGSNYVTASNPSRTVEAIPQVAIQADKAIEPVRKSLLPEPVPAIEPVKEVSRPVVVRQTPPPAREIQREPSIVRPRTQSTPAPAPKAQPVKSGRTYKVVKGDNPFRIAKRFGIHYKTLLSYNRITNPSGLQIGQVLKIPAK